MRNRFRTARICSSDNYETSHRVHMKDLSKNHEDNKEYFNNIQPTITGEVITLPMDYTEDNIKMLLCL